MHSHLLLFRLEADKVDYTKGIFQSIGFKEFHSYLAMDEAERDTDLGRQEFSKCVLLLKIATRQYSR